jgi:hypothetical protein
MFCGFLQSLEENAAQYFKIRPRRLPPYLINTSFPYLAFIQRHIALAIEKASVNKGQIKKICNMQKISSNKIIIQVKLVAISIIFYCAKLVSLCPMFMTCRHKT